MPVTIERVTVVCRLPNLNSPFEPRAHFCPIKGENNGKCRRCNLATNWLLKVSEKLPEKVLRVFPKEYGFSLQTDLNRPIVASIISGSVTINPNAEDKSNSSSPEQQ